jgi:urea carboxylase-associated protein 2
MSAHHHETLRGGDKCSFVLPRHHALTLTAASERSSVAVLAFRHGRTSERYNMPDTLKAQHTAFLTAGRVLLSDMGRVLLSVTEDTCGWHDTITGHQDAASSRARYGERTYQAARNERICNTRDHLLVELAKWELGERDLHANLNAFVKVVTDDDGRLAWAPNARAGARLTLRAELDVLVVLATTPHPLDPWPDYAPGAIDLAIAPVPPPGPDDPCRTSQPENARAFALTESVIA